VDDRHAPSLLNNKPHGSETKTSFPQQKWYTASSCLAFRCKPIALLVLYKYKPQTSCMDITQAHVGQEHLLIIIRPRLPRITRRSLDKSFRLVSASLTLASIWGFYRTEFLWKGNQTLFFPTHTQKKKKRSGDARLKVAHLGIKPGTFKLPG